MTIANILLGVGGFLAGVFFCLILGLIYGGAKNNEYSDKLKEEVDRKSKTNQRNPI